MGNQKSLSERLDDALEGTLSIDMLSSGEMQLFPAIKQAPARDQIIICAVAFGLSQQFIADEFDISKQMVMKIIHRKDPEGKYRLDPLAKKALQTKIIESRAMEAICAITPEKLKESSASELMNIAAKGMTVTAAMNQTKHKEICTSRLDNMMDMMDADAVEVSESPIEKNEQKE